MKKDFLCISIIACLVLVFFSNIFFTSNTFFQRDTLTLFHPWMEFSKNSLQKMEIPLWNPYTYCGMPFMANMQSGVFYPLNVMFWLTDFVSAYKIYLFLHFFLTGLFMYLLLRDFKLDNGQALVGAVLWTFSGSIVTRLEFLSVLSTTIWLPLEFLVVRKLIDNANKKNIILLSLVFAIQFFAGHPQEMSYGISFLTCYVLYQTIARKKMKILLNYTLAGLLAIFLSAVQLLPSFEFTLNSARYQGESVWSKEEKAKYLSLEPGNFYNVLYPSFHDDMKKKQNNSTKPEHFWITRHYIGILGFVLAILGFFYFREKTGWFLLVLLMLCLFLAPGKYSPLYNFLYNFFTPLRMVRHIGTIMYIVTFILCVFSTFGLKFTRKKSLAIMCLCIIFAELYLYSRNLFLVTSGEIFYTESKKNNFLVKNKGLHRFVHTPLTYYGNLQISAKNIFDYSIKYRDRFYGNVNIIHKLFNFYGQDTEPDRFITFADKVFSKTSLDDASRLFGLANVRYVLSYKKINTEKYKEVLFDDFYIYENKTYLPRASVVENAVVKKKEYVLNYLDSDKFNPYRSIVIEEDEILLPDKNHRRLNKKDVKIIDYQPSIIKFETITDSPAWLLLNDAFYPGWKSFIDNKQVKIYRANYLFRAINLPVGRHLVTFRYEPFSYKLGKIISLLTFFGLLIAKACSKFRYF